MNPGYVERPLFFECEGFALLGVIARPERAARVGVVIIVGGPQYRAGSHRQFVLLARALAQAGVACLRFDLRGMGDSEGPRTEFEHAHADIRAAVDALCGAVPIVEQVVLWGLCDGAAASALYAGSDRRVTGLALFNPWVRTDAGAAAATIRHYYGRRVLDRAFWRKLGAGGIDLPAALRGAWRTLRKARRAAAADESTTGAADLPARVAAGLTRHAGPTLVALSEHDLVAAEFRLAATRDALLAAALVRPGVSRHEIADADHTFSSAHLRGAAADTTIDWLRACFADAWPVGAPAMTTPGERR